MSSRLALLLGAGVAVLLAAGVVLDGIAPAPAEAMLVAAGALILALMLALPGLALRLLLLTLSCDQVLTLRVADTFTLRAAHACALVLVVRIAAARLAERRPWGLPRRAAQPLALYFLVAAAGIARSAFIAKSAGYLAWAAFDVVAVFAVLVEVGRTPAGFALALRWWLLGATVAALFGLAQLGMGFAGMTPWLVAQHLGEFPRINGFNYEPAYFALYLESAAAVVLCWWLWARGPSWRPMLAALFLGAAALSMSRSGWLGMGLLGMLATVALAFGSPGLLARGAAWIGAAACVLLLGLPARFTMHAPRMAAMALDASEPSSSAPRLGMVGQARQVFADNAPLGVGLGGYGGYIKEHPELRVDGQETDVARIVTTNLWLEVAAETGVLGLFAVLWFVARLVLSLGRGLQVAQGPDRGACAGFLVATLLVFAVLYHFNQTLWRLDVWVLLGLAWATVNRVQRAREPVPAAA